MHNSHRGIFQWTVLSQPFPSPILCQFGCNINKILELLMIMVTLKLWDELLSSKRVILQCANENSVLAINSGHTCVPGMHLCLKVIWSLSACWHWHLSPGMSLLWTNPLLITSCWHLSPVRHVLCCLDHRHAHWTHSMFTSCFNSRLTGYGWGPTSPFDNAVTMVSHSFKCDQLFFKCQCQCLLLRLRG